MSLLAYLRHLLLGPSVSALERAERQEQMASITLYGTSRRGVHATLKESPRVVGATAGATQGDEIRGRHTV